jgi:5-methylcytosine-specific restriction protein A
MALTDLTEPQAVRSAIAEFRSLGQAAFLEKYGFGNARGWMLVAEDGDRFDAKALAGAAHAYQHPTLGPLKWSEFHGGNETARKLRALGFVVEEPPPRNPPWTRDELILALDLYMRHRPNFPGPKHHEVVSLSGLLNRVPRQPTTVAAATYRNPNGVAMKLQNFRRLDPAQRGRGLPAGAKDEAEVWRVYAADLIRLRQLAATIRLGIEELESHTVRDLEGEEEAEEGSVVTQLHRIRERNRAIVSKRKAQALRQHGALRCEACGFVYAEAYGERGQNFVECHHVKPLSEIRPGERTRLTDLALLCANCHRMIHVARPWLTILELHELVNLGSRRKERS